MFVHLAKEIDVGTWIDGVESIDELTVSSPATIGGRFEACLNDIIYSHHGILGTWFSHRQLRTGS